jgi:hypothetical protein
MDAKSHIQIELPIESQISSESTPTETQNTSQEHSKKFGKMQAYLEYIAEGNMEIIDILSQQQESSPEGAIEVVNKKIDALFQGVGKTYQHINDNLGKEISFIKAEQQALRQAVEKKVNHNVTHLYWKQIATIITAAAVISTLCSLAAFQIASNWKTDQPPNPVERQLKAKSKKNLK